MTWASRWLGSLLCTPLHHSKLCGKLKIAMVAKGSYLVIGGCGFLGRHIVEQLLARGEHAVAVFDLVQRHHDKNVQFFTGDICNPNDLNHALQKVSLLFYLSTLWAEIV